MIKIELSRILGEKRLNQADLARMTGIRPSTINLLYHDFAERVSLEHLDLICEALDCDISDLLMYSKNSDTGDNRRLHPRSGSNPI